MNDDMVEHMNDDKTDEMGEHRNNGMQTGIAGQMRGNIHAELGAHTKDGVLKVNFKAGVQLEFNTDGVFLHTRDAGSGLPTGKRMHAPIKL